jgi:thioredoxin reductase (NADPH)
VGKGISYCATCDGNFFRNKDVVVVGGGDSAVADVVYLCRIAQTVHLVHRREELKASPWYAKQLKGIENLVVHWNCIVSDVLQEEGRVSGARLKNDLTGETSTIRAQGIFVAIGTRPDAAWLEGIVELDESGYIIADEGGATSVPGLFAAGDVRTTPLRQVVTAVSDGALAAEAAASFLSSC